MIQKNFYEYINWLKYLIVHFFNPWEILLNGEITWAGEDISDFGKIVVVNNLTEIYKGHGG